MEEPILEARASAADPRAKAHRSRGAIGGLLALLFAVLAKGKLAIFFALGKLKFLLLGLTKLGSLSSMALSMWFYAVSWGWPFAAGLVVSIYVHEMGHVAALRHFGIRATAPMFIPGFGAFIRLQQPLHDPVHDARSGLMGPVWGLAAAVIAFVAYRATNLPIWAAIAGSGAWINLFNLIPIWSLDGSRGFRSMSRGERWFAAFFVGAAFLATREVLLAVIAVVAAVRSLRTNPEEVSDRTGTALYCWLIATLSLLAYVAHAGAPRGH